jgi:hypothetical protein
MIRKTYEELIIRYQYSDDLGNRQIMNAIVKELTAVFNLSHKEVIERLLFFGYEEVRILLDESTQINYTFDINVIDAIREYHENIDFQELSNSGLFIFVDGHIVINDEKYIDRNSRSTSLTKYAGEHLNECAISFNRVQKIPEKCSDLELSKVDGYKKLHLYDDTPQNHGVFDKARALNKVKDIVEQYHEDRGEIRLSFHEIFNRIYERKKWNSTIFKEKTLLDDKIHSRLRHDKDYRPSKRTILSIAVGASLDIHTTEEMLLSAGYAFESSLIDDTYRFVINEFSGCSIDEVNEVLESCGVTTLGTLQK